MQKLHIDKYRDKSLSINRKHNKMSQSIMIIKSSAPFLELSKQKYSQ